MTKAQAPPDNFHPAANVYPMMKKAALQALADDIKAHGLHVPIVRFKKKIIDGRNRFLACQAAGVRPKYIEYAGKEEDIPAVIAGLNEIRRHLSDDLIKQLREQRKLRIKTARSSGASTRQIAEAEGISQPAVLKVLKQGQVITKLSPDKDEPPRVTGKDGKSYPATAKSGAGTNDDLGPHKDERGDVLPDGLKDIFGDTRLKAVFAALKRVCSSFSAQALLGNLCNEPNPYLGYADLQDYVTKAEELLTLARDVCEQAMPYCICPECKGKAANNGAHCPACINSGWMTKDHLANQPKAKKS